MFVTAISVNYTKWMYVCVAAVLMLLGSSLVQFDAHRRAARLACEAKLIQLDAMAALPSITHSQEFDALKTSFASRFVTHTVLA